MNASIGKTIITPCQIFLFESLLCSFRDKMPARVIGTATIAPWPIAPKCK